MNLLKNVMSVLVSPPIVSCGAGIYNVSHRATQPWQNVSKTVKERQNNL